MPTRLDFRISHTYNDRDDGIAIPVRLIFGERDVRFTAIVDTGSTFCVFERIFAESLGLDIEAGDRQEFRTAAGRFVAFGHELTLSTLGLEMDATVYFFADAAIRKNVLGRRGWLDRVRLAIVDYEQVLYLEPYASTAQ